MNDEIKEIDNSDLMELLETTSKKDFYRLTLDHELVVRLYNWITNLQQENEILKENAIHNDKVVDNARWNEMIYKSRIDKINELLNRHDIDTGDIYYKYNNKFVKSELKERIREITTDKKAKDVLLNILNGGDE